jgi:hypothetical protein
MLTPQEIRAKAERKYPDYLKSLVTGETLFPLRIKFGQPNPTDDFAKLKAEVEALNAGNFGYTIETEQRNLRRWGVQPLPTQVRFDTEDQFAQALSKSREVATFKRNVEVAKCRFPALAGWLRSHVNWVVEFESDWDGMLAVCDYFLANPCPGLYVRQLPIPVHTKFIAEHSEVLTSMLTAILPDSAVNREGKTFEDRFGLRPMEATIRFRALDPVVVEKLRMTDERMGLPLDRFRLLPAAGLCVIITENLMNLECLPSVTNGLGIWGQGNAAELLTRVDWLAHCEVLYWGDIDEHGFHILARLRKSYSNIRSLMMEIQTLNDLCDLAGAGEKAGASPSNLNPEERAAFDEVERNGRRLEQEKIPLNYSIRAIGRAASLLLTSADRICEEPGSKPGLLLDEAAAAKADPPGEVEKCGRH